MAEFLAVFIGGGIGSMLRFGMSRWIATPQSGFPLATLAANFAACLLLGFLTFYLVQRLGSASPAVKFALTTGFCGGFSTFSTFSQETMSLLETGRAGLAFLYVAASVLICLAAVWIGQWAAKTVA